jgi:alanine dehydrogenase
VLYLYTESELCDNCLKVYETVKENTKLFKDSEVLFGFLDLFKNQHKLLKEEDVPLILIYKRNSN